MSARNLVLGHAGGPPADRLFQSAGERRLDPREFPAGIVDLEGQRPRPAPGQPDRRPESAAGHRSDRVGQRLGGHLDLGPCEVAEKGQGDVGVPGRDRPQAFREPAGLARPRRDLSADRGRRVQGDEGAGRPPGAHQPSLPAMPLTGPVISAVIQPP